MNNDFKSAIDNVNLAMAKAGRDMDSFIAAEQAKATRKRRSEEAIIKSAKNIDSISKNVSDIRNDLSEETNERKMADKKNRRFNIVTLFIAILGVLIALAAWLFPIAT